MTTTRREPIGRAIWHWRAWHARLRAYAMAVAINVSVTASTPVGEMTAYPALVAVAPDLDRAFDPREVGGPAVILTLPFTPGEAIPPIGPFNLN